MIQFKRLAAVLLMAAMPVTGLASAHAADSAAPAAATVGLRGDIVYGAKSAPLELIEYGSFTCPHCAEFANDVFPVLKKDYIDTGKLRFVFRNFARDQFDIAAAEASRCTTDEKETKAMIATFFKEQEQWLMSENQYEAIAAIAAKHGVSKDAFATCLTSDDLAKHLVEMKLEGIKAYKIQFVPTLVLNGKEIKAHDLEGLKALLDGAH